MRGLQFLIVPSGFDVFICGVFWLLLFSVWVDANHSEVSSIMEIDSCSSWTGLRVHPLVDLLPCLAFELNLIFVKPLQVFADLIWVGVDVEAADGR